jgi:hypothetical protein
MSSILEGLWRPMHLFFAHNRRQGQPSFVGDRTWNLTSPWRESLQLDTQGLRCLVDCHLLLSVHGFLAPSSLGERRQINLGVLIHSLIALVLVLSIKPFSSREFAECFLNRSTFPYLHVDIEQQVERVTVVSTFVARDARPEFPAKEVVKPRGLSDFIRNMPASGLISDDDSNSRGGHTVRLLVHLPVVCQR